MMYVRNHYFEQCRHPSQRDAKPPAEVSGGRTRLRQESQIGQCRRPASRVFLGFMAVPGGGRNVGSTENQRMLAALFYTRERIGESRPPSNRQNSKGVHVTVHGGFEHFAFEPDLAVASAFIDLIGEPVLKGMPVRERTGSFFCTGRHFLPLPRRGHHLLLQRFRWRLTVTLTPQAAKPAKMMPQGTLSLHLPRAIV